MATLSMRSCSSATRHFRDAASVPARLAFYMTDEKGSDEKIICTSLHDPAWLHVHDIDDL
jgi:inorganic pyrophosphatase